MHALMWRSGALMVLLMIGAHAAAETQRIRVGVVFDGPAERLILPPEAIEREIGNLVGPGLEIVLPAGQRFAGDWTLAGVDGALTRALTDPKVDVVVTLGFIASHQAARRVTLPKPVIAPLVIDAALQGYPVADGRSGRRNFSYVADFRSVGNKIEVFHRVVGFRHLAALVDEVLLDALPELKDKADALAQRLGVRISVVRMGGDVGAALAALPGDADAAYVATTLRSPESNTRELAQGLIARKLPSFSVLGASELESGLLITSGGAQQDIGRLARRVTLMIQRIAQGEDPATFEVGFPTEQPLTINMRTARAIGFSPHWRDLADAEILHPDPTEARPRLTLPEAMKAALDASPALVASTARLASAREDVRLARSELLPSLGASAALTRIDADRASALTQAEETMSASVTFEQQLYSERNWAGYAISRYLLKATEQGQRAVMLDTLESASNAYLDLLRAESVETVRRGNVGNTRRNLEISRVRQAVGLAGRSDYLRWVAQLARDKQNLLAAESTRRQAETELSRVMHRPASQPFATVESGLDDPLALVDSPRAQAFLDTPAKWALFTEYVVRTALERAPEIARGGALVRRGEHSVSAARRAYLLPDVVLMSHASRTLDEGGAGSQVVPGAPDDESWDVSVQARFPLFTSGARAAELDQARHDLRAAQADRAGAIDAIEARARISLHRAAGSHASIGLSGEAAAAARENLAMVTDAYARGAVSVTDLIDAQDAALSSDLAAAEARYAFLADFVAVLRVMGDFDVLLDTGSRDSWLRRAEKAVSGSGAASPARQPGTKP